MKQIAALAGFAVVVGSGLLAGFSGSSDETLLRQLNSEYVASFVNSDPAHYDKLLAPDFKAITPGGVMVDRATFLKNVAGPTGMKSFEAVDVTVEVIGNVGIVQARTPWVRNDGATGESLYTDIWVKKDGQWHTLRAQVTRVQK